MFYNGLGFTVFRKEREIYSGFETTPLGSNNIGEFTNYLKGMQSAKSITKKIEIVGDCMILTKSKFKYLNFDLQKQGTVVVSIQRANVQSWY